MLDLLQSREIRFDIIFLLNFLMQPFQEPKRHQTAFLSEQANHHDEKKSNEILGGEKRMKWDDFYNFVLL